jgi:hypothetical protein
LQSVHERLPVIRWVPALITGCAIA